MLNFVKWKNYKHAKEGWQPLQELKEPLYDVVTSAGLLIDENTSTLTLASSMMNDMVNGVVYIPKSNIISRDSLSIKDFENVYSLADNLNTLSVKIKQLESANDSLALEKSKMADKLEKLSTKAKLNTKVGRINHDSATLKEVPEEFYGINVKEFMAFYPNHTYVEIVKKFNTHNHIITALINLLVRLGKVERHPRYNWRRSLPQKKMTTMEQLKYERENLTELPETFHGINVADFIKNYANMSHKTIRDYYNVPSNIIAALIHILVRLGKVEKRNYNWKSQEAIENASKKTAFRESIDLNQFKQDYLTMPIKEMVDKYKVSDYTIYTTGSFYGLHRKKGGQPKEKKTKIQILMEKETELAKNLHKTQKELAKMYKVSPFTISTVLRRLHLNTNGRNTKLVNR